MKNRLEEKIIFFQKIYKLRGVIRKATKKATKAPPPPELSDHILGFFLSASKKSSFFLLARTPTSPS